MTSGVNTVRPGASAYGNWQEGLNGWTVTGAASAVAALSDNSDASYCTSPPFNDAWGNPSYLAIPMAAPTLPSNESVNWIRVRVRLSDLGGGTYQALPLQVRVHSSQFYLSSGGYWFVGRTVDNIADVGLGAPVTSTGSLVPNTPENQYWMVPPYTTGTPGNYIQHYNTLDLIGLGTIWYNTKQYRVYELYVDYFFNDDPSVPTAAAATNLTKPRPTVVWSVTDTENDAMLYHDTWYYTNAQATAPGFYPGQAGQAARTTVYFNGNVGTPLTQYTVAPNVDLLNNTTYRSYSRITQVPQGRQTTFGTSGLIAVAFVT